MAAQGVLVSLLAWTFLGDVFFVPFWIYKTHLVFYLLGLHPLSLSSVPTIYTRNVVRYKTNAPRRRDRIYQLNPDHDIGKTKVYSCSIYIGNVTCKYRKQTLKIQLGYMRIYKGYRYSG